MGRKDPKAPPNPPVLWPGRLPPGQGAQGPVQPCLQHPHGSGHPQGSAGPGPAPQHPPGRASPPGLSPPSCTLSPLPLALIAAPPSCLTPGRCELPAAPPPLRQHPPDSPGTDRQPRTHTQPDGHTLPALTPSPPPSSPSAASRLAAEAPARPRPGTGGRRRRPGGEQRGLNAQHRDRDRHTGQHRGGPRASPPPPRFPPEPARSLSARHTAPGGAGQPLLASSEPASSPGSPSGHSPQPVFVKVLVTLTKSRAADRGAQQG